MFQLLSDSGRVVPFRIQHGQLVMRFRVGGKHLQRSLQVGFGVGEVVLQSIRDRGPFPRLDGVNGTRSERLFIRTIRPRFIASSPDAMQERRFRWSFIQHSGATVTRLSQWARRFAAFSVEKSCQPEVAYGLLSRPRGSPSWPSVSGA